MAPADGDHMAHGAIGPTSGSTPAVPAEAAARRLTFLVRLGRPVSTRVGVRWSTVLMTVAFAGLGGWYLAIAPASRAGTTGVPVTPTAAVPLPSPSTTVPTPTTAPRGTTTTTTRATPTTRAGSTSTTRAGTTTTTTSSTTTTTTSSTTTTTTSTTSTPAASTTTTAAG